jgi:hypothetical protein
MKYTVEKGSGTMIYLPSFIKIGSDTHRQLGDLISLVLFFQNK